MITTQLFLMMVYTLTLPDLSHQISIDVTSQGLISMLQALMSIQQIAAAVNVAPSTINRLRSRFQHIEYSSAASARTRKTGSSWLMRCTVLTIGGSLAEAVYDPREKLAYFPLIPTAALICTLSLTLLGCACSFWKLRSSMFSRGPPQFT